MRNILIVGGSTGIGSALLEILVKDNTVINLSRNKPQIQHENLTSHQIDVLADDLPEISALDAIVYCPGSINLKPIGSLSIEDFKSDFDINVIGAIKVIKAYHRTLKKGSNPSLTMFSTVAVGQGMPFHTSVAASKGAVEGVVKSLAAEFAPTIRVNCIAPTITNTPLAEKLLRNEAAIEKMEKRHPLNMILQPDDIANMAAYLISEKAKGITGQIVGIDAGLSTLKV